MEVNSSKCNKTNTLILIEIKKGDILPFSKWKQQKFQDKYFFF